MLATGSPGCGLLLVKTRGFLETLTSERQKRVVRLSPVTNTKMKIPASRSDSSRQRWKEREEEQ